MIVATLDGTLARAQRGKSATCPGCAGKVYGREPVGAIRHWAHNPQPDGQVRPCDKDRAMTEWHRTWQDRRTDPTCIEVYRDGMRADAINAGGFAVEFQHSAITEVDVRAREKHWRRGVWVLDGTGERDGEPQVRLMRRPDQPESDPWRRFGWRHRCPLLLHRASWPCWIDLGDDRGLLQVRNAEASGGNGWLVPTEWFVAEVLNGPRPTLREHKQPVAAAPTRARRRPGMARPETPEDLAPLVRDCTRLPYGDRDLDDGTAAAVRTRPSNREAVALLGALGERVPCCGGRPVGVAGEPLVLSCQLCPSSPTYWRDAA